MSNINRTKSVQKPKTSRQLAWRTKKRPKFALTHEGVALDNTISTAAARRISKARLLILSEAEIARINGAQVG